MIGLVDVNSYFCNAELVFRPDLRGRPVIVLSNSDGMVVAANKQAQRLGCEKFKPYFEIKHLCEIHAVAVFSSNHELYIDLSCKLMSIISKFAPKSYIYSVDEQFLDFTSAKNVIGNYQEHGTLIRNTVWRQTRLPVCVGIAPTLTLAKIANHIAKHDKKRNGVCVLDNPKERDHLMSKIPASKVWGIGGRLSEHLRFMGITNALQLSRACPFKMRKAFSVEMERTIRELRGEKAKYWDDARADKKQIFSTRTLGNKIYTAEELTQALTKRGAVASMKARKQKSLCSVLMAFANSSAFDEKPVYKKAIYQFEYPTADSTAISKAITSISNQLFVDGVAYNRVGVGLIELVNGVHQ